MMQENEINTLNLDLDFLSIYAWLRKQEQQADWSGSIYHHFLCAWK